MGVSLADCVTVTELPEDVVIHILTFLAPRDICAFASVSPDTRRIFHDASIWTQVARRHLRISSNTSSSTRSRLSPLTSNVDDLKQLVDQLIFHWHVSIGVLMSGIALHRRTGFSQVTPRGGVELKLSDSSSDSAYVFGGSFAHLAVPNASPALILSFPIHEDGPFPVDGMRLRLMHAAEPVIKQASDSTETLPIGDSDLDKTPVAVSENSSVAVDPHAKICLTLNGHLIDNQVLYSSFDFETSHFHVPSHLLVTAPASNLLAVEYDRSSTAGYWLRDVALVPTIATLPPPPEKLPLPLTLPDLSPQSQSDFEPESPPNSQTNALPQTRVHLQFHLQNPSLRRRPPHLRQSPRRASHKSRSPRLPRSPRSPRQHSPRSPPHVSVQNMAPLMLDGPSSQARREHLQQPQAIYSSRRPKHMYHRQNHARSPRTHYAAPRSRAHRWLLVHCIPWLSVFGKEQHFSISWCCSSVIYKLCILRTAFTKGYIWGIITVYMFFLQADYIVLAKRVNIKKKIKTRLIEISPHAIKLIMNHY